MKELKVFLRKRNFVLFYLIERLTLYLKFLFSYLKAFNIEKISRLPDTIQLPITYKCNYDCKMCGMRRLIGKDDYSVQQLDEILKDKLFKNVKYIGLSGGEPFIRKDLVECVEVMIRRLPKLQTISIITNGYFTEIIIENLEKIKIICKEKNISVHVSVSVDGIYEMQNLMRGNKKAWINTNKTILALLCDKDRYFDGISIICTITKFNVYELEEMECWAQKTGIEVSYNIATINERIDNKDKYNDFTLLNDPKAKEMAMEFFYKKALIEKSKKYFALYLYLRKDMRFSLCPCRTNRWVTLTPNGRISYCATHSKEFESAIEMSAYEIFNSHVKDLMDIREKYCMTCSHYTGKLNRKGTALFYKELLREQKVLF